MVSEGEFLEFAAEVFGVPGSSLSLETSYASIPEWDSMAQLRLVMETASRYGVEIPFAEVTNVRSLWEFRRRINGEGVKKVVAVDLDNTLWEGVVGEDGVAGIRPDAAFQTRLLELKRRGVLLVALSKNNPADVDWLFGGGEDARRKRPAGMVLSEDDFVAWRIDWNGKADNLASVARELNLGTDSFVFVDDNPAERLEMGLRLPEVTVAEFPPNLEAYFPERALTEEDRVKTEQYKAESRRRRLCEAIPEVEQTPRLLFERLGVRLDVHEMTEAEASRVAQLSQKANQFNVCTNRYQIDDVRRLAEEGMVVTAHAGDRFGDQGLVAYVIVKDGEILDWVMSCRVMGRGIEERIERRVESLLRDRGAGELRATWRASGRNVPVRELFERFGFDRVEASESLNRYRKALCRPDGESGCGGEMS